MFAPIARAISQLDDPIFRGVLLRSLGLSIICFVALHVAAVWMIYALFDLHGLWAWAADALGSIGASLLALWLFLPIAAVIGTIYLDRIAEAVERRFYPSLPSPNGASLLELARDGTALALKVLALNVVALIAAFLLPGIGLVLSWVITAYAIGRGLFVAVAMRRMTRPMAEGLYRANQYTILAHGAILALASYIPVLNLLIPILGVAAMVHVLDVVLTAAAASRWRLI